MPGRRKDTGRARFIVVFEKAKELILIVETSAQMTAHRTRTFVDQAVVEALVVAEIEA